MDPPRGRGGRAGPPALPGPARRAPPRRARRAARLSARGPADAAEAARAARRRRWSGIAKYALLQVPELLAVGLLALGARSWWGVPGWVAALAVALWVAKDVALYPLVRVAYESGGGRGGTYDLVGAYGTAQDALEPRGYVRVASELWHAELAPGAVPVARGGRVHVRGVHGLTLVVEPADEASALEPPR